MRKSRVWLLTGAALFLILTGCQEKEAKENPAETKEAIADESTDTTATNLTAKEKDTTVDPVAVELASYMMTVNEVIMDMNSLDEEYRTNYMEETDIDAALRYLEDDYNPKFAKKVNEAKAIETKSQSIVDVHKLFLGYLNSETAALTKDVKAIETNDQSLAQEAQNDFQKSQEQYQEYEEKLMKLADQYGIETTPL